MNKKLLSTGLLLSSLLSVNAEEGSNADEAHSESTHFPSSVNASIGFNSEDTTFGCRGASRAPYFEIVERVHIPLWEIGTWYVGNENDLYIKDASDNGFDFFTGVFRKFGYFKVDGRYTYTILGGDRKAVRAKGLKDHRNSLRFSLEADVLLHPTVIFVHNFTLRREHIKLALSHLFDLAPYGASGFSIKPGAYVGYAHTKRPGGKAGRFSAGGDLNGKKKGWVYAGANINVGYAFTTTTSASVGVGVQGTNEKKAYAYKGHKHAFLVTASLESGF
jgi:hypothetical protein